MAPTGRICAGLAPVFLSYVLSFVYVGIYWNNHHHLLHTSEMVDSAILWANMHLLFWLSLIPFATGWMGENHFAPLPTALYGVVLLMPAIAYYLLQRAIIRRHGSESVLAQALGTNFKGKISPVLYLVAIGAAFVATWISHLHLCPGRADVAATRPQDRERAPLVVVSSETCRNELSLCTLPQAAPHTAEQGPTRYRYFPQLKPGLG